MPSNTMISIALLLLAAVPSINTQSISSSPNFKLVASLIDPTQDLTPSIELWEVITYPISSCLDHAILSPPASNPGRTFFLNGTYENNLYSTASVLTDSIASSSPPTTDGLVISTADTLGRKPFQIVCGDGTHGVGVVPKYSSPALYYGGHRFYACQVSLGGVQEVQIFANDVTLAPPVGCPEVKLYAQCVQNAPVHSIGYALACCGNVAVDRCGEARPPTPP